MRDFKKILLTAGLIINIIMLLASCGANNNTKESKETIELKKCEKLIDKFAMYATEKDSEEICKLIFTDEMVKGCNKLYYVDMNLQITNRNLQFKQSFSELFETIEYEFTDTTFSKLSEEDLYKTLSYYEYLGYKVDISEGYLVTTMFNSSAGYRYPSCFPVVKIAEDEDEEGEGEEGEGEGEWKLSPLVWDMTFGNKLEEIRRVYTEEDFINYGISP